MAEKYECPVCGKKSTRPIEACGSCGWVNTKG